VGATLLGLLLVCAPLSDLFSRWRTGKRYREVKNNCLPDDWVAQNTIRKLRDFYEPRWYHFAFPGYGFLILTLKAFEQL
jgi:hypothetical protein